VFPEFVVLLVDEGEWIGAVVEAAFVTTVGKSG